MKSLLVFIDSCAVQGYLNAIIVRKSIFLGKLIPIFFVSSQLFFVFENLEFLNFDILQVRSVRNFLSKTLYDNYF